jgi:hypothetical protein
MNRRQITCLWIVLTLLCPLVYLLVEYLVTTGSRISETYRVVWESNTPLGKERTFQVRDTNGAVYLLKTDKAVLTEGFIEDKIRQLQPLSPQQIEALDKNKELRDQRIRVLRYALIGIFVTGSFTGLYLYRARANLVVHIPHP